MTEFLFTLSNERNSADHIVKIGGVPVRMCIDSGATCNIIEKTTYEQLKEKKIKAKTELVNRKIFAYGSTEPLKLLGKLTAIVECGTEEECYAIDTENGVPLLEKKTAIKLNVLRVGPVIETVNTIITDADKIQKVFKSI